MKKDKSELKVAVVGTGPAGLMAADVISMHHHGVILFEKNKSPARKLLIAGSSGLNITNSESMDAFEIHYPGATDFFKKIFSKFSPKDWLYFIHELGFKTFLGTSGRYFLKEMKASKFARAWLAKLSKQGVDLYPNHELVDIKILSDGKIELRFSGRKSCQFNAVCLCLGGASYTKPENTEKWLRIFKKLKIKTIPFFPSNVGYQVHWPAQMIPKIKQQPLKNIRFTTTKGSILGDIMLTEYGMEGTPVYTLGDPGIIYLDLKPDLSDSEILKKCRQVKENFSAFRRIQRKINLCEAALTLLFHMTPKNILLDLDSLVGYLKNFPIELMQPQPIKDAISTGGGVDLNELNGECMLKKAPGIFLAGEMLNWDTKTGGFLIQGCVSTGFYAGFSILKFLGYNSR